MAYIIDGHNMIPKLPGLGLDQLDDETHLVEILVKYARLSRRQLTVYFDNAPPGHSGKRVYGGRVTAWFVPAGSTADDAILRHLIRLGKAARNYAVVSSDRQVQANARQVHAQVISSETFAAEIIDMLNAREGSSMTIEPSLSSEEIDEWLAIFNRRKMA